MRLVDRIGGEMFTATRSWLESENPDRVAALRQGLRDIARIWSRHADVLEAMNEASHLDEAAQRFFRGGVVQQYIDQIAKLIRQEKRQGLTNVANPNEVARALIHSQCQLHDGAHLDGRRPPGCGCVRAIRDLGRHAVSGSISRPHLSVSERSRRECSCRPAGPGSPGSPLRASRCESRARRASADRRRRAAAAARCRTADWMNRTATP